MPNDARFTGHFRRPNETGPGFEITLSIGETATRISLGDDVLGTWPNSVIALRNRSPLTLRILGETWLVSTPDPQRFLEVAEAHFGHGSDDQAIDFDATPEAGRADSTPPEAKAEADSTAGSETIPARDAKRGEHPTESEPSLPPSTSGFRVPGLALPRSGRTWGGVVVTVALLVTAFAFDGPLPTVAAVLAGGIAVVTASVAQRERAARRETPHASLATADVEAQFARALGSAIGKSQSASAQGDIDDLMNVRGIGRQYAQVLMSVGVGSLEQLANLTPQQRSQVERALGTQGERLGRERWAEQAAEIIAERRRSSGGRVR